MKSSLADIERFRLTAENRVRFGVSERYVTVAGNDWGMWHFPIHGGQLRVVFSPGWQDDIPAEQVPWEHASVSGWERRNGRVGLLTPTWEHMERVRHAFWRPDETVMQLHVPVSDHVNVAPNCLHLWRPTDVEIPRPPQFCV